MSSDQKRTLEQKVDRILFYLESDPKTKHVGLVEQVGKNTESVNIFNTDKKVFIGIAGVISFIFGSVGGILMKIFLK